MGKLATGLYVAGSIVFVAGWALFKAGQASDERQARERAELQRSEDSIVMHAEFSSTACMKDYPVHVVTTNKSTSRTLKSARFKIGIYAEGRSANLNDDDIIPLKWDRVVAPGETLGACYAAADLPKRMYYLRVVRDSDVYPVEFYRDGEFIPRAEPTSSEPPAPSASPSPRAPRPAARQ